MQITLTAPYGMKMKLEMPEEKISDFMRMVFLYGSEQTPEPVQTTGADALPSPPKSEASDAQEITRPKRPGGYKGFLTIRCEECGEIKNFCTKYFITKSHCNKCGHSTKLRGLKPLFLKCKCGGEYKYRTNMDEECFDLPCINCGNPVDVELNKRGDAYVTISDA